MSNATRVTSLLLYWTFTMRKAGGVLCVTYVGTPGKITVTGAAGTFTEETIGSGVQFTCPDGSAYQAANALVLLNCLDSLPGNMNSSGSSSVDFSLMGGPGNAPLPLFSCAQ